MMVSAEGQTKEGMHGAPIGEVTWPGVVETPQVEMVALGADESWPGATAMPQEEPAQLGSSPVQTETAAHVMEVMQPDATTLLQTGAERPGSLSAKAVVPTVGQTEENAAEASSVTVVAGQRRWHRWEGQHSMRGHLELWSKCAVICTHGEDPCSGGLTSGTWRQGSSPSMTPWRRGSGRESTQGSSLRFAL